MNDSSTGCGLNSRSCSGRPDRPHRLGAEDLPRLTFEERYSQQWPEHAADIHRPDFEELAAARNKLFERQELYSSKWSTVDPQELPISLAKPRAGLDR